jgi:hypothetical protein
MSAITTTVRRWPNGTTITEFRGPDPVEVLAKAQAMHAAMNEWLRCERPKEARCVGTEYVAAVTKWSCE